MKVIFSQKAENNLTEIAEFIAKDNPVRAVIFINELIDKAENVSVNPYIYPVLKYDNRYRKKSYKGYILLYKIGIESIEIIHILNSMRDYTKLL